MVAASKVAIVTGAGTGVAEAVALALFEEGYSVFSRDGAENRWKRLSWLQGT